MVDNQLAGAYSRQDGRIYINDMAQSDAGHALNTLGHETSHYLDHQADADAAYTRTEGYQTNREEYADNLGDTTEDLARFQFANNDEAPLADDNHYRGTLSSAQVQANSRALHAQDPARLDSLTYRSNGREHIQQLASVTPGIDPQKVASGTDQLLGLMIEHDSQMLDSLELLKRNGQIDDRTYGFIKNNLFAIRHELRADQEEYEGALEGLRSAVNPFHTPEYSSDRARRIGEQYQQLGELIGSLGVAGGGQALLVLVKEYGPAILKKSQDDIVRLVTQKAEAGQAVTPQPGTAVTGPRGGRAVVTDQTTPDGQPIYRRESGGYYTIDPVTGRQQVVGSPSNHGNVLNDTPAECYALSCRETGTVKKYGETIHGENRYGTGNQKRYSDDFLIEQNVDYRPIETGTKREMHQLQHELIIEHKKNNDGKRPDLNQSDY